MSATRQAPYPKTGPYIVMTGTQAPKTHPSTHLPTEQPIEQLLPIEQRAKLFAALADPTRLRIVDCLLEQHEASGSSLAKQMDISLALFCHHSKTLIASGLVIARKQGQTKFLSLNHSLLNHCCRSYSQQD